MASIRVIHGSGATHETQMGKNATQLREIGVTSMQDGHHVLRTPLPCVIFLIVSLGTSGTNYLFIDFVQGWFALLYSRMLLLEVVLSPFVRCYSWLSVQRLFTESLQS